MVISDLKNSLSVTFNDSHGVHSIWKGVQTIVRPASILALRGFYLPIELASLIQLVKSEELNEGSYRVKESTGEGFYFQVEMAENLFNSIQNPRNNTDHCNSILTGALASGLEILKRDYADDENFERYPVLKRLSLELQDRGLPLWYESNFRADEVATRLRPIVIPD